MYDIKSVHLNDTDRYDARVMYKKIKRIKQMRQSSCKLFQLKGIIRMHIYFKLVKKNSIHERSNNFIENICLKQKQTNRPEKQTFVFLATESIYKFKKTKLQMTPLLFTNDDYVGSR